MSGKKIKVGIVGLVFGGAFPTIYRDHPDVEEVVICDKNEELLNSFSRKFGFTRCCRDYQELLDSDVDAVHILTNIHTHADLAVQALNAGKHCAVTVPMATTLDEIRAVIEAKKKSGKNYMMMETSVYTYQCLYVKSLIDQGKLGKIQYLRGTHFQDMEGWPDYWKGLPPLHYATHAISPLLFLSGQRASRVHCFGSGTMREELVRNYAPYVYTFEEGMTETNIGNRGRVISRQEVHCPNREEILPEAIRKYTTEFAILDPDNPDMYMKQGGGHHGSHPHLVNEFVSSIIEEREPMIDVYTAADWTAAGICGHESAMKNGEEVVIPEFR